MDKGISVGEGALWVFAWFGIMLLYTFLDVAVWRKITPGHAKLLNVISIALCMGGFLSLLKSTFNFQIDLVNGISLEGIFWAIGCAVVMYFLLDKFLDPVFEGMLPGSEERYQETLGHLRKAPVLSFIQVCILVALLHFNMVQTLSALICGIVLGLLYIRTDSLICCIAAHAGYNMISFFTMIFPFSNKP